MTTETLLLEVQDFVDPTRWRWVLKEPGGAFLADHPVVLRREDPEYAALLGLPDWLWVQATADPRTEPDRRAQEERVLLDRVGAWIGDRVFGPVGAAILAYGTPAVVRVIVPPAAQALLLYPLEIAYAEGRPLALQDVSLIFQVQDEAPPVRMQPVGPGLRLLALFSLPPGAGPLNLRRERQMLKTLVAELVGARGLAVELRVLQYGVTRDTLRDALAEAAGWDLIHFSGHGLAGALVLETAAGRFDLVSAHDVAQLLRRARGRLKLVTLSACLSAAASLEQTRHWLGLEQAPRRDRPIAAADAANPPAPTLARELVRTLDCAVLAMRYTVEDEFATAFALHLYEHLFEHGQELPRAAQGALAEATEPDGAAVVGALSLATPALFGRQAAALRLVPPRAQDTGFQVPATGLFGFPPEAAHFVGRVAAMTRASAALAAESGTPGVLFHGMAGAGKTSCAVELAWHYEAVQRFRAFVWYKAPEAGKDIALSLRDFALALERQVPGMQMVHVVDRTEELTAWLAPFRARLRTTALLIVLDNLETLLTAEGNWRDARWGLVVEALLDHGGLSRTVLTSRVRPAGLPAGVEVIPVHALPLDEALLLVRELPLLGRLVSDAAERALVRRALRLVQGHPKLIELAEGQAADPAALAAQLDRAEAAWAGDAPALDAFFRTGESGLGAEVFLHELAGWTEGIAATLPETARTFFHFLCALEEDDRISSIVLPNWPDLWKALGRPEPAPESAKVIALLAAAGLVEVRPIGEDAFALVLHPGVAESGRAAAGDAFRTAADAEMAAFWRAVMVHGLEHEGQEPSAGAMIRRAGLAATPYLLRREDWEAAASMLEQVINRDQSPATVAAVLPLLRRIADATTGTKAELKTLARLSGVLRPAGRMEEAEGTLRDVIARAEQAGEFNTAGVASTHLVNLLRETGRPEAALELVEQMAEFTRRAGRGPWTQLGDEGQRLQVLNRLGRHAEVLRAVDEAQPRMAALSDRPGPETVLTWHVREGILDTGRAAATDLEQWQAALDLAAEIQASKRKRGASLLEQARTRFNDYGPLLRLGRFAEVRALLYDCRPVFERENAMRELSAVLSALADLEDKTVGPAAARRFEEAALRYEYAAANLQGIAISHFNLAHYLRKAHGPLREALAHRLAAVLLAAVTGSGRLQGRLRALASDLAAVGQQVHAHLPADFAALCATLAAGEGVRFREVFEHLAAGRATGDALLQDVLAQAFGPVGESSEDPGDAAMRERLARHAPLIQAVATAARQPSVRPQLNEALAQMRQRGWGNLVDAVGRLLDGERDKNALCAGLDREDSLIVATVLRALADPAVLAELQSPRSEGETED